MKTMKMTFVRWTLAFLVACTAMSAAGTVTVMAQEKVKIAYVDLQRALNEVEDGKKAKAKLKRMFSERQKKLDKEQEALKALKGKLEKELQGDLLSDDKKREKMADYQKRFYTLQQTYVGLQKELTEAEAKETQRIFKRFQEVLQGIGLKQGYTIILEKSESSVLWAPKSLDITDQLIQGYNKK